MYTQTYIHTFLRIYIHTHLPATKRSIGEGAHGYPIWPGRSCHGVLLATLGHLVPDGQVLREIWVSCLNVSGCFGGPR